MNQIPEPFPAGAPATYDATSSMSVASHERRGGRGKLRTRRAQGSDRHGPPRSRSRGGGTSITQLVLLVIVVLAALAAIGVATGSLQLSTPQDLGVGAKGAGSTPGVGGDAWSYYHDQKYETDATGPKWQTDRTRSTDPDEAVLGSTSRWEYDGPYRYGPYGNDGMRRRASGRESADPLYSQAAPIQDVFSQYGGDLDPSGGAPVGAPPSNFTNPYYDPYAGYSNPYANRIRLAYGEGYGRGAASAAAIP